MIKNGTTDGNSTAARPRPLSPNIQIYRPQLTSVLSIANRITGVVLSPGAVGPTQTCSGQLDQPISKYSGAFDLAAFLRSIVLMPAALSAFLTRVVNRT